MAQLGGLRGQRRWKFTTAVCAAATATAAVYADWNILAQGGAELNDLIGVLVTLVGLVFTALTARSFVLMSSWCCAGGVERFRRSEG